MTIKETSAPNIKFEEENRDFWLAMRHALLIMVGAIEKKCQIHPLTSELRKQAKPSK
jgi:hypothetical protein